ncbi:Transcription termination factor MTERF5, chloroplastic [Linum perenne]
MLFLKVLSTYRLSNLRFGPGGACFIACYSKLAESSTTSSSALVNCLISTFKFTDTQAISIAARFSSLKSPEKPQALSGFLRGLGFTDAHLQATVAGAPQILFADIETNLKPKIQHFQKLGLEGSRLVKFLSKNHTILTASLTLKLVPRLKILQKIVSQKDLAWGLERCSWVLYKYPEKRLSSNIELLQSCGIVGSQLAMLFRMQPRIFLTEESKLRDKVSKTLDFGFSVKSKMFVYGLWTVCGWSEASLEKKLAMFNGLGFSREECIDMFRKAPVLLRCSEDKLKFGIDFYLNTMKLTKDMIVRTPSLLMYSMTERVIPRYRVLEIMESKALLKIRPNFTTVVSLTNARFVEKFVFWSVDHAEELLMVFNGHDVDASKDATCF